MAMVMDRASPAVPPVPPAGGGLVMVGSAVAHSRHSPMRLWVGWGGAPHIGQGPRLLSGDAPASTCGDGADKGLVHGTHFLGLEGVSITLARSPLAPLGCRSLGNGASCLPRRKNKWYREQRTRSHQSLNPPQPVQSRPHAW